MKVNLSYSQIAVFDAAIQSPFSDWTDRHVSQGFAWRLGSVSFKTLVEAGECNVDVKVRPDANVSSDAKRAILVPFKCQSDVVEIASISDGFQLDLSPGEYGVLCQQGWETDRQQWIRIWFVKRLIDEPRILVCDSELTPEYPLLMEAASA